MRKIQELLSGNCLGFLNKGRRNDVLVLLLFIIFLRKIVGKCFVNDGLLIRK